MKDILQMINWYYCFSVVLVVFLWLTYVIKYPNRTWKIVFHIIWGAILGFVWYKYQQTPIQDLILSFLVSVVGYVWIVKQVLEKIGSTYDNGKGLI